MNSNDNPNPTLKKKTKHQKSKQFMANIITMLDISARIGRSVEQNENACTQSASTRRPLVCCRCGLTNQWQRVDV